VAALGTLGLLDAGYMLAYSLGVVDRLVCPLFGSGCERVARSTYARHLGIPNSAVGAAGYATLVALAAAAGDAPARRRPVPALGMALVGAAAAAASAYLTWAQAARVGAWCFWCLTSAGLNAVLRPLVLAEARELRSPRAG
jgi:uncharacterized membrane protein